MFQTFPLGCQKALSSATEFPLQSVPSLTTPNTRLSPHKPVARGTQQALKQVDACGILDPYLPHPSTTTKQPPGPAPSSAETALGPADFQSTGTVTTPIQGSPLPAGQSGGPSASRPLSTRQGVSFLTQRFSLQGPPTARTLSRPCRPPSWPSRPCAVRGWHPLLSPPLIALSRSRPRPSRPNFFPRLEGAWKPLPLGFHSASSLPCLKQALSPGPPPHLHGL